MRVFAAQSRWQWVNNTARERSVYQREYTGDVHPTSGLTSRTMKPEICQLTTSAPSCCPTSLLKHE
eukprot:9501086-Pyramimonas_sp.AAC.1